MAGRSLQRLSEPRGHVGSGSDASESGRSRLSGERSLTGRGVATSLGDMMKPRTPTPEPAQDSVQATTLDSTSRSSDAPAEANASDLRGLLEA